MTDHELHELEIGCNQYGRAQACYQAAQIHLKRQLVPRGQSLDFLEKGCELGHLPSCQLLTREEFLTQVGLGAGLGGVILGFLIYFVYLRIKRSNRTSGQEMPTP